ncbi:MAG: hypothetical protein IPF56_12810 [Chloroflexi bacterium]|nr:hypothetical protein [Chloroflexota bacterium]
MTAHRGCPALDNRAQRALAVTGRLVAKPLHTPPVNSSQMSDSVTIAHHPATQVSRPSRLMAIAARGVRRARG